MRPVGRGAIAAPSRRMAGLDPLTPVPNRIGLKSYIRLSLRPEEAERFWKIEPAVDAAIVVSFAG